MTGPVLDEAVEGDAIAGVIIGGDGENVASPVGSSRAKGVTEDDVELVVIEEAAPEVGAMDAVFGIGIIDGERIRASQQRDASWRAMPLRWPTARTWCR